jgi:hypothetical protein
MQSERAAQRVALPVVQVLDPPALSLSSAKSFDALL